jgi:hypothetical protein
LALQTFQFIHLSNFADQFQDALDCIECFGCFVEIQQDGNQLQFDECLVVLRGEQLL